eukprot:jgi/Chlat1/7116/Chrsp57S00533
MQALARHRGSRSTARGRKGPSQMCREREASSERALRAAAAQQRQQQQQRAHEVLLDEGMLTAVLRFLDAQSLSNAACVCRTWAQTAANDLLWRALCTEQWPSSRHAATFIPQGGYRSFYVKRMKSSAANLLLANPPMIHKLRDYSFFVEVYYKDHHVISEFVPGSSLEDTRDYVEENSVRSPIFHIELSVDFNTEPVPCTVITDDEENDGAILQYLENLKISWSVLRHHDNRMACLMQAEPDSSYLEEYVQVAPESGAGLTETHVTWTADCHQRWLVSSIPVYLGHVQTLATLWITGNQPPSPNPVRMVPLKVSKMSLTCCYDDETGTLEIMTHPQFLRSLQELPLEWY